MWCDVRLFDLLLPHALRRLRRPGGDQLCAACRERLPRLGPPLCARCGAPTAWPVARCRECAGRRLAFASARAAVAYDDDVRRLVRAWKERGLRRLAARSGGGRSRRRCRDRTASVLAFVPPDRARSLQRGHHPAERLARELGERWSLPVDRLVARTRPAPRQRGLALADRRRNVARSVRPCLGSSAARSCSSTTSTRAARRSPQRPRRCARAGARRVNVVTFARVVR